MKNLYLFVMAVVALTWGVELRAQGVNGTISTGNLFCIPVISTTSASSIADDSVVIGGNVMSDGGSAIVLRGVCYSLSPNPDMSDFRTQDGSGTGVFSTVLRGLSLGTTYYACSYAKNVGGLVAYGNEVTFTTLSPVPLPCPGAPTVSDVDGNSYATVKIGTQCWTQSNLTVSKYRNGDTIPNITDNTQWSQTSTSSTGAWCNYNNDASNGTTYGKLYNWYAVNDSRGLCPTGWHVPTDSEWNVMVKYLDPNADTATTLWQNTNAGTALKSTTGWNNNGNGTNSSGFTGLPGGFRSDDGGFGTVGSGGYWWSSSAAGSGYAWSRNLIYYYASVYRDYLDLRLGLSVRCVRDSSGGGTSAVIPSVTTASAVSITANSATTGGNVTADGGAAVTARGVAYGTSTSPTISGTTTSDGTGTGVFTSQLTGLTSTTLYYVRAYATNAAGTAYGNELTFTTLSPVPSFTCGTTTVTDIDGNSYATVQIGTQCWTQSNLTVSKYRDGSSITNITNLTQWGQSSTDAWCNYNNDASNGTTYGKLYNWYAVNDSRGLCPTGWHVPTDSEWNVMVKYLDPNADTATTLWQNTNAGTALKSTTGWNNNGNGTNSSGFTGLPGGVRSASGGFASVGNAGYWWSSSASGSGSAWYRHLLFNGASVYRASYGRRGGFSVRCVRD